MKWLIFAVFANAIATVFLKLAAMQSTAVVVNEVARWTLLAAALLAYGAAFGAYHQSLIHYQVGVAYASITSATAILVGLIGVAIFGEVLTVNKALGLALICAGIVLLSASNSSN